MIIIKNLLDRGKKKINTTTTTTKTTKGGGEPKITEKIIYMLPIHLLHLKKDRYYKLTRKSRRVSRS